MLFIFNLIPVFDFCKFCIKFPFNCADTKNKVTLPMCNYFMFTYVCAKIVFMVLYTIIC